MTRPLKISITLFSQPAILLGYNIRKECENYALIEMVFQLSLFQNSVTKI